MTKNIKKFINEILKLNGNFISNLNENIKNQLENRKEFDKNGNLIRTSIFYPTNTLSIDDEFALQVVEYLKKFKRYKYVFSIPSLDSLGYKFIQLVIRKYIVYVINKELNKFNYDIKFVNNNYHQHGKDENGYYHEGYLFDIYFK